MISLAENRDFPPEKTYQKSYQPQTLKQKCIYNLNIEFLFYLYTHGLKNMPHEPATIQTEELNLIFGARRMFEQK